MSVERIARAAIEIADIHGLGAVSMQRVAGELGWMECALTVLDGTGLQGSERIDTVAVVAGHIRMIAQQAGATEHPEQAMGGALAALMRTHGDRYPAFTAALTAAMAGSGQDNALDFGLQRILDGLEALIARRA